MYKTIQKVLDWAVKIASLAITGPATWIVAGELFTDIQSPVLLFVMKFSAVLLIEGVLLSNWLLLEFDKKANPEIKARYALTALTMYVALAIIGFQHEGATGIVFRVALLAALIGSGWDTFVYTWQRMTSKVDRSVESSRRVKAHARRLAIKEAKAERDAEHALITARLEASNNAQLAEIDAEHEVRLSEINIERVAGLKKIQLYGARLDDQLALDDREERTALLRRDERLSMAEERIKGGETAAANAEQSSGGGSDDAGKKGPSQLKSATSSSSQSKVSPQPLDDFLLKQHILDVFADDPSTSKRSISIQFEISAGKVSRLVRELIAEGKIMKDGRNHYVMEEDGDLIISPSLSTGAAANGSRDN